MEDLRFRFLIPLLLAWGGFSLAFYLLKGAALYRMAKNAGVALPGLAWVPVLNNGVLGTLCDRASLCLTGQLWYFRFVLVVQEVVRLAVNMGFLRPWGVESTISPAFLLYGFVAGAVPEFSLTAVLSIAFPVVTGIALYRLYEDYIPERAVVFTLLSLVFGGPGQSILLFLIRKDIPYSAIARQGNFRP